jgi:hypothetical protein
MHVVTLSSPLQRQFAQKLIWQAPNTFIAKIHPPGRTIKQNDRMWEMLTNVSAMKPRGMWHPPVVWKSLFMSAFGYEMLTIDGLYGEPVHLDYSTKRLNVKQMIDLQEFITAWCAAEGFYPFKNDQPKDRQQ